MHESRINNILWYYINNKVRQNTNILRRRKLKNRDICLLSNNCNGAMILHDLGLRFNSPFVNLWLEADDFVKYLSNIEHYRNCNLTFVNNEPYNYPVGKLDDIKIYFMHYKNEVLAQEKWIQRSNRIDIDHLFIIMTEKENCSYNTLLKFDSLPYKNKVVFTHRPYPEIKSSYYLKGFENQKELGILSNFKKGQVLGKRYYDDFDFINFFNNGKQ